MGSYYKFAYKTIDELKEDISKLELDIPVGEDLSVLADPVKLGEQELFPNRLAVHPMEGCDANSDGTPTELTMRRYKRFARGGAGLIWFEAVAINELGRANDTQLFINDNTLPAFKQMVETVRAEAAKSGIKPFLMLQLTHAGRFGRHRRIVFHHDTMDQRANLSSDHPVISDEELASLQQDYVKAAKLAEAAGFDGVDIKSCHRYLLSENLAAHLRKGPYGGDYENRTRLLKDTIREVKAAVNIEVAIRMNAYDGIPYPYGWANDSEANIDLSEPKQLVKELRDLGVRIINITAGTPYLVPHITRPYDLPMKEEGMPEHQLIGVNRLIQLARELQAEVPECVIVGTGYTWLRQFAPQVAAGVIEQGWAKSIGFGRLSFAYPDFAKDIINDGELDKKQVCIACSKCAALKAATVTTGCVVRDSDLYAPVYQQLIRDQKKKAN